MVCMPMYGILSASSTYYVTLAYSGLYIVTLQLLEERPHEVGELFHLFYLDVPNIGNSEGIYIPQLAWIDGKA